MMDATDLEKPDPKRVDLEQDRIVLEYATNQLRTLLSQVSGTISTNLELANAEKDLLKRAVLHFKIEQIKLLTRIIGIYDEAYYRLVKEDSL